MTDQINANGPVTVVIAEDSPTQAEQLQSLLERHGYRVTATADGRAALAAVRTERPAFVISDVMMPEMDGYALCRAIKSDAGLKDTPVILTTALSGPHDILEGLACGADNFVTKPYRDRNLLSLIGYLLANRGLRDAPKMRTGMEIVLGDRKYLITAERQQILDLLFSTYETAVQKNEELVRVQKDLQALNEQLEQRVEERTAALRNETAERQRYQERLRQSLEDTVRAVAATVEIRDPYTAGHQRRVAELASAIARELGLEAERVHGIYLAGVVHDLGKIHIPAEILSRPARLNRNEFNMIKTHPQVGHDILKDIEFPWPIARIVLQHHERLDGSGYPQGLRGDAILPEARILAVADVIEAMSSHRPYRPGLGLDRALAEIQAGRGTRYDPSAVDACLAVFEQRGFTFGGPPA
jgi:putative nucleotidyltransferase with HDIG domain